MKQGHLFKLNFLLVGWIQSQIKHWMPAIQSKTEKTPHSTFIATIIKISVRTKVVRKTILIGNHLALRDFDVKTTWYILQYNNDNDDDDDNKNNSSTNNNKTIFIAS